MAPQRGANRTNAGASGALLLPQFLARAGNFPAGLGGVSAAVLPGAVVLHRLPEQIFVDRAENFVGEVEGPDLLAAQIVDVNRCHIASRYSILSFLRRPLRCLQRIDRSRTRESAALSGWLLRFDDNDVAALRTRHAAFDHKQVLFFVQT